MACFGWPPEVAFPSFTNGRHPISTIIFANFVLDPPLLPPMLLLLCLCHHL
jgi:hypothetical protein